MRKIPKAAYKVQDAPGLIDDFYQVRIDLFIYKDILDWSSKDIIAIAQANSIYFWTNKETENNVLKISEALDDSIYSSLKWNATGQFLAAGTNMGIQEIFDNSNNVRTSSIKALSTSFGKKLSKTAWGNGQADWYALSGTKIAFFTKFLMRKRVLEM